MFVTFSKDKVMNFKKYLYAFAAVLMTVIAPSCVKDGYGEPMISTDKSTYEIPLEGGEVKVMLTSTRSWIARVFPATSLDDIEGIVVEPASGKASSEPIEVTIKATANASYPRAALISFETSVVSAAVTVNQDGPVARPAAELTVAEFLKKEVDASIYYKLTGTIKNLKNTEYGNFDLVDETGSVYVYGLTTEKQASNDKSFSQLGLKEGDVLTLEGTRAAYNGSPQVGGPAYYISHEAGDAPAAPGPKSMTIAEAVAQTDSVLVSGTVMALCAKGFILQDESGIAFIYDSGYSQTYVVGDQVKVGGKPGAYNYANQITPNAKYYEKTGSAEVTYPDPVVLNAAKVAEMKDGAGADKNVGVYNPFYITVEGTVRVSGNYFNLDIDGVETSTAQGSFYQLTDAQKEELTALKDKAVVLTGYFQSISQSGGVPKFFNVIYLTVEEKEAEGGEEPTEKAARNLAFSAADATATLGQDFIAPTLSGKTDGVAYSSSNTAVATVDAATGAVTLVAAGETTITAAAEETETLQAGTASYTLTVSEAAVELPAGISAIKALATAAGASFNVTLNDAVVTYVSGSNAYVQDAEAGILIYKSGHGLIAGDKLSGEVSGTVKLYNNLREITDINISQAEKTSGAAIPVTELTLAELNAEGAYDRYENMRIKISKAEMTGDLEISQNGQTYALYKKNSSVKGFDLYNIVDVIGYPGKFYENVQLNVFEDATVSGATKTVLSGFNNVELAVGDTKANKATASSGASVSYASASESIATVDENGTITGVAVGETTITASVEAYNGYPAATATCTVKVVAAGTEVEKAWTLVTDASTLAAGDKIIIVAKGANYAMSTTQNSNNRAQAAVTKDGNTLTFTSAVQEITLEEGTLAGTFAFNVGSSKYLYAASSSSNHLKTGSKNDNASWKIEIANTSVATIKAQGASTRNWLRYNSSNNPPIFSCYGSGQADVVIYKYQ